MKLVNFFLKHKAATVIFLILLALASYGFLSELFRTQEGGREPTPAPSLEDQATYKSLSPGTSTEADTIEKLGEPKEESQENELERLKYLSSTLARDHEVIIENDKVVFIKEIITQNDNKTADEITDKYGNTDKLLYGPHSSAGFDLYIYPENGIAYIGNSEGILIEIWYFEPMNFEDFKSKWATGYTETRIPQQ